MSPIYVIGDHRTDPRFVIEPFEPCYLQLYRSGELRQRVEAALDELKECRACPRECGVNRLAGQRKVCGIGRYALVSSAFAHMGEEAPLRGWAGSGTIFFSMCNLKCVFCQNWDISQRPAGRECNARDIADIMLALQRRGCHNINLVTPEHVVPQVIEALAEAIERGLRLPVVYNTSAYDSLRSLRLLDGLIDIYMPDFKYWRSESAARYSKAADYPERAREAIKEMHRQVGDLRFGPDGIARRGLLVRHLVMPGLVEESKQIVRWLASEVSKDTYLNIMGQYRPQYLVGRRSGDGKVKYEAINRPPTYRELSEVRRAAEEAGLWRFD